MSPKQALAFVKKHGVVLQAARGPIPSLAEAAAGERIRGSWWGHPKSPEIFFAAEAIGESPDVLVCKLVEGKVTYVHRRLWPALVRLASSFPRAQLAKVWSEHTASGAHRARRVAFPTWVPADVAREAQRLPLAEAQSLLSPLLAKHPRSLASASPGSGDARAGPMPRRSLTLRRAVQLLRKHQGPPEPPPTTDPFELILWENVAYLAAPARRREAFELLKSSIGVSPKAILSARRQALERVTSRGILKATFAAKLRECARIATFDFGGDLGAVMRLPVDRAKRALRSFPGIGEPGAEKILLFAGRQALLAPDSNALRVLVRLGLVREGSSYSRTYAAARTLAGGFSTNPRLMQEAHQLLQKHGQSVCKRAAPRCTECPLARECAHARREPRKER
jgi:endonuclease-3